MNPSALGREQKRKETEQTPLCSGRVGCLVQASTAVFRRSLPRKGGRIFLIPADFSQTGRRPVGSSRSHKIRGAFKNTDANREHVQHTFLKKQKKNQENNNRIYFISIKIFGFLFGCSSCSDLAEACCHCVRMTRRRLLHFSHLFCISKPVHLCLIFSARRCHHHPVAPEVWTASA